MLVTDALLQEKGYTSGELIIKELSQNSHCKTLIDEAQSIIQELGLAAIEIHLESTKSGFSAEQDYNIIRINPHLSSSEQRGWAIFELTNVIHHKEHQKTDIAMRNGVYKSAEDYTRAKEFIEFEGVKRWTATSRAVNKQYQCSSPYMVNDWESIPIESMDFEIYYSQHLANHHKDYYATFFNNLKKYQRDLDDYNRRRIITSMVICISVIALVVLWWPIINTLR